MENAKVMLVACVGCRWTVHLLPLTWEAISVGSTNLGFVCPDCEEHLLTGLKTLERGGLFVDRPLWTTATGERIPYEHMSDDHLRNAVLWMRANARELLDTEVREAAQRRVPEDELRELMSFTASEFLDQDERYDALITEAHRRGIEVCDGSEDR